jgi:hypothetical protein
MAQAGRHDMDELVAVCSLGASLEAFFGLAVAVLAQDLGCRC